MNHASITLAFLLFLISLSDLAFSQRKEDVVYLSNGTIIRGLVLEDSTANTLRILNHAGDTWVFDRSMVDSVKKERPFEYKAKLFNQRGFEFSMNAEFLIRSGNSAIGNAVIPGVDLVFGYRITPWLSAGTEVGMQFYEWMEMPLSVSFRARSSGRALSPLVLVKAGYTLPVEKRPADWEYEYESRGGFSGTLGIGMERIISDNASLLFTFSYHYQELNYHLVPLQPYVRERDRTEAYSRFRLAVGYVFK